jgi:hypothetical protein
MNSRVFQSLTIKAATMASLEHERADYWHGYQHGLRRAHFGERFGAEGEHRLWMTLATDGGDESRRERGRGYRDGLNAKKHDRRKRDLDR